MAVDLPDLSGVPQRQHGQEKDITFYGKVDEVLFKWPRCAIAGSGVLFCSGIGCNGYGW